MKQVNFGIVTKKIPKNKSKGTREKYSIELSNLIAFWRKKKKGT